MLAGVGSAITGCTAEDAIKALLIWLALALGGGTAAEETTSGGAAPRITMYDGGIFDGNLGGRAGADDKCTTAAGPLGLGGMKIHAYISVDGADDIKSHAIFTDLPLALPIKSTSDVQIATDWDEALNHASPLDATLQAAGILPADSEWWSGSNADGTAFTDGTCEEWTMGTPAEGQIGSAKKTDDDWIERVVGNIKCSTNAAEPTIHLLCVAY